MTYLELSLAALCVTLLACNLLLYRAGRRLLKRLQASDAERTLLRLVADGKMVSGAGSATVGDPE